MGQSRGPQKGTHVFRTASRPLDQNFCGSSHGPGTDSRRTTKFEMMKFLELTSGRKGFVGRLLLSVAAAAPVDLVLASCSKVNSNDRQ